MSEKMSKEEEMKAKMKAKMTGNKAKNELFGKDEEPITELTESNNDSYTFTVPGLMLKLADPEQTFGTKADRVELIGCFFEPKVAKAIKKDQRAKGRGWQSHLVNELVKQYYKEKGSL